MIPKRKPSWPKGKKRELQSESHKLHMVETRREYWKQLLNLLMISRGLA